MRHLLVLPLFLFGCSSAKDSGGAASGAGADDPDTPTWHRDVAPIVAFSCDSCHQPGGVGSPTWSTAEEATEWAVAIADAVQYRRMPPWQASDGCADYVGDFSLDQDQIDTIVAWAEGGAPLGSESDAATIPDPFTAPVLERVDMEIRIPEPYTPTVAEGTDDYRCFLIDWPYDETVWVSGYQIRPDDRETVHHVIPYIIEPGSVDTYRALDAAQEGEGYTCFGGPGGDVDSLGRMRWLGAWAPGSGASVMPEGTGIRVEPGSLVAFQVHYNLAGAETVGADQSGLDLMISEEALGWADIQPWTDISWVIGAGMEIPANTASVEHAFSYTVEGSGFTIETASIHMHNLGQQGRMWVEHADGSESCLVDYTDYDFNWQRGYRFKEPVSATRGDVVHLSCTWDNPTDEDVKWGDGTADEMCLGVTLLTE
jgi:hypothetical protein